MTDSTTRSEGAFEAGQWIMPDVPGSPAHAVTRRESDRWKGEAMSQCGHVLLVEAEDRPANRHERRCQLCERTRT